MTLSKLKNRLRFLPAAIVMVFAFDAMAQPPIPVTIEERRNMRFGEFGADLTSGGTVVLNPNTNSTTVTGPLTSFGGSTRTARFRIEGEPRAFVNVTLPTSITIERGTSGRTMVVDTFTMDRANPIRLSRSGRRTINIGATLRVGVNQRRGNYNDQNEFTVEAEYD